MNSLGASILLTVVAAVLSLPRRWALLAATAGILYLTQAQRVEIGGFNVYAFRFVELAAFCRVVIRGEFTLAQLNRLDRLLIALYVYTVSVFLLRSSEDQAYQIGTAVDAILAYFSFRGLINGLSDLKWFLYALLLLLVPYVVLVSIESLTANNPFSRLGGVELIRAGDRWIREGRLRATGSFGHPSLMGTLGGTFLPLYVGLLFAGKARIAGSLGVAVCLTIVWASNSGGPFTCVATAVLGWLLFPMRTQMQWFRRGLTVFLILVALAMKAPIWYLLARISNITGGDGYHRSALIDAAFRNLDEWWLAGMRALDTSTWLPYTNLATGGVDITNHFLVFGIAAGIGSMVLLIALITEAFKQVGRALCIARSPGSGERAEYVLWGAGVMLGVHIFNWFGISYWDQSGLFWFLHLATINSLAVSVIVASNATANESPASGFVERRFTRPLTLPASGMLAHHRKSRVRSAASPPRPTSWTRTRT